MGVEGLVCAVTGGSGFVGQRLTEMLVERGASKVISFDINGKPEWASDDERIQYIVGDLTKLDDVVAATKGVDCLWHVAAAVGPFLPPNVYKAVNYYGTLNVLEACRANNITKLVMSSSPSTRFDGNDVMGLREDEMQYPPPGKFMQAYAETKAMGEKAVREACCDSLMTIAIAPHQVYGPRDPLFLPSILSAGKSGKLRILGSGQNLVSFTHVDNYCHALILGHDALYKGSQALGQYYNVTDDGHYNFWDALNEAVTYMGFADLKKKLSVPTWLVFAVAYVLSWVTYFTGTQYKLNWFTAKTMTMHRYFDISKAKRELNYTPLMSFQAGWSSTLEWFKDKEDWWQAKADAAERR